MAQGEVYPYPDQGLVDGPLPPLFVIECQPRERDPYRAVVVCHECFHKLDPDQWIGQECWERISPMTPFEKLPLARQNGSAPEQYQPLE